MQNKYLNIRTLKGRTEQAQGEIFWGYYDAKGYYSTNCACAYDSKGFWRLIGEGGYDGKGYYQSEDWCTTLLRVS